MTAISGLYKNGTKQGFLTLRQREAIVAYLFMLPQLIGLFVFIGRPMVMSLYYTFTKWNLIAPEPTWVGLDNWKYLFDDPRVEKTVGNTVEFIGYSTTSFLILSLLLALLLHKPYKGVSFFRGLFFVPYVVSQVAIGITWSWMFNSRSGPIPKFFDLFGFSIPNLLLEERYAMIAVAIVATWQALGYGLTIYLAGLNGIPEELYDAASVDGASAIQKFRSITIPLLSPTIFFLTVTSLIAAFQLFDLVVILTGGATGVAPGGPNGATRTIVLYLYEQTFVFSERLSGLGYGATLAWLLAFIIFAVTLVQWVVARKTVFYFGETD
jgi:multiple sugar transport system permease protein